MLNAYHKMDINLLQFLFVSKLPYLDENPRMHTSSVNTATYRDPDPDPDVLVNAMSLGQYDTPHQVATLFPRNLVLP